MAFTYNINAATPDPLTLVRLLINDKYEDDPIYQDAELAAFLVMESGVIKCAAALALERLAADEVLVQKVIKTLTLSTDGAKVAAELRANAKILRDQAENDAETSDGVIDILEWNVGAFNETAIYINTARRRI